MARWRAAGCRHDRSARVGGTDAPGTDCGYATKGTTGSQVAGVKGRQRGRRRDSRAVGIGSMGHRTTAPAVRHARQELAVAHDSRFAPMRWLARRYASCGAAPPPQGSLPHTRPCTTGRTSSKALDAAHATPLPAHRHRPPDTTVLPQAGARAASAQSGAYPPYRSHTGPTRLDDPPGRLGRCDRRPASGLAPPGLG